MGTDFLDDLGETLSRTAREFGERAESLYETQKLRGKIAGEEHAISKAMTELGKSLYREYKSGRELTEEQKAWCEQIDQHKVVIGRFRAKMAGRKGKKICPSCGESVDQSAAFCPYCGAACKKEEPENAAGDAAEEPAGEAEEGSKNAEENFTEAEAAEREAERPEIEVELSEMEGDLADEKEDSAQ